VQWNRGNHEKQPEQNQPESSMNHRKRRICAERNIFVCFQPLVDLKDVGTSTEVLQVIRTTEDNRAEHIDHQIREKTVPGEIRVAGPSHQRYGLVGKEVTAAAVSGFEKDVCRRNKGWHGEDKDCESRQRALFA